MIYIVYRYLFRTMLKPLNTVVLSSFALTCSHNRSRASSSSIYHDPIVSLHIDRPQYTDRSDCCARSKQQKQCIENRTEPEIQQKYPPMLTAIVPPRPHVHYSATIAFSIVVKCGERHSLMVPQRIAGITHVLSQLTESVCIGFVAHYKIVVLRIVGHTVKVFQVYI